jgi:hypothetical protein
MAMEQTKMTIARIRMECSSSSEGTCLGFQSDKVALDLPLLRAIRPDQHVSTSRRLR